MMADYEPGMQVETQEEADAFLEKLVLQHMASNGDNREKALQVQRSNLAYYAAYYSAETRERVERLFKCAHPYFGAIAEKGQPTPEEAFEMVVNMHIGGPGGFYPCRKCRKRFYSYELDDGGRCLLCRLRKRISFYAWLSANGGQLLFLVASILGIIGLLIY